MSEDDLMDLATDAIWSNDKVYVTRVCLQGLHYDVYITAERVPDNQEKGDE